MSSSDHVVLGDGSTAGRFSRRTTACMDCFCSSAACSRGCACIGRGCARITPQTSKGSKRCGVCAIIVLALAIGLIIQAVVLPQYLHNQVTTLNGTSVQHSRLGTQTRACCSIVVLFLCVS
jgi:hypothetical protein